MPDLSTALRCPNVENNLDADVAEYLNTSVFHDRSGKIGQLLLDLGNYYKLESGISRPNDSEMSMLMRSNLDNMGIVNKLTAEHFDNLEQYISRIEDQLEDLALECKDAELVIQELENGIHFVKHAVQLGRIKQLLAAEPAGIDPVLVDHQIHDLDLLLHQYRQLWTRRNRLGGLEKSVAKLLRLRGEYAQLAAQLSGSQPL